METIKLGPYENFHDIDGEEKARYLHQLDRSLSVLEDHLATTKFVDDALKEHGNANKWDWDRLPIDSKVYQTFSELVGIIRREYQWFDRIINEADPSKNRDHFQKIDVSAASGLPLSFNFMTLNRLKGEAPETLKKMPGYDQLVKGLRRLLMEDQVGIEDVQRVSTKFTDQALRRSFLEQLQQARLLSYQSGEHAIPPRAQLLRKIGGEELWTISLSNYISANGIFEVYVINAWQDVREPQIKALESGQGELSPALLRTLKNAGHNAKIRFMLSDLDERFKSLHPVHVSRGLVGPFECKYMTKPEDLGMLPITQDILSEDPNAAVLRFTRQYTFAPNHEVVDGEQVQVIPKEDWSDEIIVCPRQYSSRVSKSVLGTNVRIFEV